MDGTLHGRRAVVTAGCGGAGQVIAEALCAEGATVFTCDIDPAAVAAAPAAHRAAIVDVADADAVVAWLGPIAEDGIDVLVNNAGIAGPTAPIEHIDPADWRRCISVGLDSMFHTVRVVAPTLKANRSGAIINIASTAGVLGMPERAPYVAAKFGVVGLTKTLAMELGPFGVRVNAIAPGSIHGDRMDRVIAAHAASAGVAEEQVRAMYTAGVSMGTFVEPEEIADLVVYLASDRARSVSGQVIAVDGHTETLYPRTIG